MNSLQRTALCALGATTLNAASAQQSFDFIAPEMTITADRLLRGDADTYGLGDWLCSVSAKLEGTELVLRGHIVFSEKANDFTTIVGSAQQRVKLPALENCRHCALTLVPAQGTVAGPNIGARGYRWFAGKGLIERAYIQTDTFGDDAGHIGGTIRFAPVRVVARCAIAAAEPMPVTTAAAPRKAPWRPKTRK